MNNSASRDEFLHLVRQKKKTYAPLINPCFFRMFVAKFNPTNRHGIISIQSLGRLRQNVYPCRGIHQTSDPESQGLPADTCRDLHQQSHSRDERTHPATTVRHLDRRPRVGTLSEPYPRRSETEEPFHPRHPPGGRHGTAIHAARLQPFPCGDDRLFLPVRHAQPRTRTGAKPQPEH